MTREDEVAACRSCGAPIVWTRTTQGSMMPLDQDPADNGNVIYTGSWSTSRSGSRVPVVRVIDPEHPTLRGVDPGDRFVSHFATCPQAEEWRT